MNRIDESPKARAANPDELVTLFSASVWRFVSSQLRCREDAEDVVMETFAAAFRDFNRVLRADDQGHWLLGIARRKVADHHRKHHRRAERPLGEAAEEAARNASDPEGVAAREGLALLPEAQREVLTLKYISGLTVDEIAELTRRTAAATNSLLQRGRESLRLALQIRTGEER